MSKPFSDEELEAIEEFNQPREIQSCKTMTEASMIYSDEKRKKHIRRFLATIAAKDKRVEELENTEFHKMITPKEWQILTAERDALRTRLERIDKDHCGCLGKGRVLQALEGGKR